MMAKAILIHVLMAAIFFTLFHRGQPLSSFQKASLDNFIREILACRNIPGLSISLVRQGRVEYSTGYGFQEFESFSPVTNTTTFCIGSLTKGFTATIMAMLISENDRQVLKGLATRKFYGKCCDRCENNCSYFDRNYNCMININA